MDVSSVVVMSLLSKQQLNTLVVEVEEVGAAAIPLLLPLQFILAVLHRAGTPQAEVLQELEVV